MTAITESLIDDILDNPFDREWSIQGFGMLRTYLDDERVGRLHIWDQEQAIEDVSTVHDHPWDFTSRIVRGYVKNVKFRFLGDRHLGGGHMRVAKIRCGEGGGITEDLGRQRIGMDRTDIFGPGDAYSMFAPELHETFTSPGAVTVIERSFHADRDIATVCWREGEWVSAEPRPATRHEIEHFVRLAKRAGA